MATKLLRCCDNASKKILPVLQSLGQLQGTIFCRHSNTLPDYLVEHHRKSALSINKEEPDKPPRLSAPRDYRYVHPDFLPDPTYYKRDRITERLERQDMLLRRSVLNIPEFYVGSILAVTIADPYAPGKKNRFIGICIQRGGHGLRSYFTLRNVVDGIGVEIRYDMYNPTVQKMEILKLEKRLDDNLIYLRDAPQEYSTVPFDMEVVPHPPGTEVPLNTIKVPMNPYPWSQRWELHNFQGADMSQSGVWEKRIIRSQLPQNTRTWEKYDMMKWYRENIQDEEAEPIMDEVYTGLNNIEHSKTTSKKK